MRAGMSLYEGAKTRVRVRLELSEEFKVKVGVHQGSMFSSNGESNVLCKTNGEKENRGPDGDVRIEGNSGSDGKGEWSEMVRACVEEG